MTKLYAPTKYWNLSTEDKLGKCNGCGTKGFIGWLVPDTIYLLNVTPACDIHDYMYSVGSTLGDKDKADRAFLNNLIRLINDHGGLLKPLRLLRAKVYYKFVKELGGPAFWDSKNQPAEFKIITNNNPG